MSGETKKTQIKEKRGPLTASVWQLAAAEFCGTALLLLLSCLPAATAPPARPAAPSPLAAGLIVAVIVQCFDHVSGAWVNPAVLVAAAVRGRVRAAAGAAAAGAQLAGALAGAAAARALASDLRSPARQCLTLPRDDLPLYKAVLVEFVLGGVLALVNCGSWDARVSRLRDSWPLRIGLAVAALTYVGGELTGASMNPARSLAPALLSQNLQHQWIYWVGPLGGSLTCSLLYGAVWAPPAEGRPPASPPSPACPSSPATPRRRRRTDSDLDKLACSV